MVRKYILKSEIDDNLAEVQARSERVFVTGVCVFFMASVLVGAFIANLYYYFVGVQ